MTASPIAAAAGTGVSRARGLVVLTAVLIGVRLVSGLMPLAHDEAYYWLWSTHLDWGYYDHPPAVAVLIRLGTAIFGKTELGVRIAALALAIPTTLAVARSAQLVTGDFDDGCRAALFFNVALMVNAQVVVQNPDTPALFCTAAFLWALLELLASGQPWWWLVAGLFAGLGLLSKYTLFMVGLSTAVWLLWSRDARHWLFTPWPWLGGLLALAIFAPNLVWNATRGWPTVLFQFGRIPNDSCPNADCAVPGRELLHFVLTQVAMISPVIFLMATVGVWRAAWSRDSRRQLVAAFVVPSFAYFAVHALHAHVHDNWPSFLYPALIVAAVDGFRDRVVPRFLRLAAVPVALVILAACYLQIALDLSGLTARRVLDRYIALNMAPVATGVADAVSKTGAHAILTATYSSTAWLRFYARTDVPVIQAIDAFRYPDSPVPSAQDLRGPVLLVDNRTPPLPDPRDPLGLSYAEMTPLGTLVRPRTQDGYNLYLLDGFQGTPFGRIPYP